jgi:hypothetical protein
MVAILSFRSFKLSKTVLGGVVFAIGFVGFFFKFSHGSLSILLKLHVLQGFGLVEVFEPPPMVLPLLD